MLLSHFILSHDISKAYITEIKRAVNWLRIYGGQVDLSFAELIHCCINAFNVYELLLDVEMLSHSTQYKLSSSQTVVLCNVIYKQTVCNKDNKQSTFGKKVLYPFRLVSVGMIV